MYHSIRMKGSSTSVDPARIFDRLSNLADTTRSRLLLVLEDQEASVGELCAVLRLPQSTVSRHLKVLADEGWLESRADGTSRRYRMTVSELDAEAVELWALVRDRAARLPAAGQDVLRLASVLAERRSRSQEFFAAAAGDWDRLRGELFGDRSDLQALLGLLDPDWVVGDLGCGTGRMAATVAPFVGEVIAVDGSREMLEAARARLADRTDVDVREGRLEELPVADGELDAAIVYLVLHYLPDPAAALAEAHRALRPGGRLLVADMTPHDRREWRNDMGHVWLGFPEEQMLRWLADAGFARPTYRPLPPDPAASGPALFTATGRRPAEN